MSVGWRRLVATEATMAARRRGGILGHPAARAIGAGALAGGVLRALDPAGARAWWLLAALGAGGILMMAGPFRMFWRSDASLLGRLPIAGRELYRLALVRSLRLAGWLALALVVAALPCLPDAPLAWARLVGLGAAVWAAGGVASPAVTAAAGAMVVSAKTQELIRELASGQTAPGAVWLSLLPAAGAGAVGWAGWLAAATPTPLLPLGGLLAGALAAAFAAAPLAASTLDTATREIAALDAVRLAHVDKVGARGLERLWGRLTAGSRLVYDKDVALARRRHPGYYLLTGLGILALWIVAAVAAEGARDRIAVAGIGALMAYALLHARRLAGPPIERPRLLDMLPIPVALLRRAKAAHVAWRVVWVLAVAGGPAVARSPRPGVLALVLGAMALATIAAGAVLSRPPRLPSS